jgi:hypothetical protein
MLKIAEADVNLSTNEPLLLAEYAPRYRPMNVTMIVDVVNNNIVLGNFSRIIALTFCEPELLVKKRALPRSSVRVFTNFVPKDLGEYHGSSSPSACKRAFI